LLGREFAYTLHGVPPFRIESIAMFGVNILVASMTAGTYFMVSSGIERALLSLEKSGVPLRSIACCTKNVS
jgi:hypothetical protein